jgi:hypothetical protein
VTVDWLSRGGLERDEVVALIDAALVAIVALAEGEPWAGADR